VVRLSPGGSGWPGGSGEMFSDTLAFGSCQIIVNIVKISVFKFTMSVPICVEHIGLQ